MNQPCKSRYFETLADADTALVVAAQNKPPAQDDLSAFYKAVHEFYLVSQSNPPDCAPDSPTYDTIDLCETAKRALGVEIRYYFYG